MSEVKAHIRIPEDFENYAKSLFDHGIMSNFDREINTEVAEAIKDKKLFSSYPAYNFHGKVWWQDNQWHCEVWTYNCYNETFSRDSLEEIMEDVSSEYGYD